MALDDDARGAELAGELADLLEDERRRSDRRAPRRPCRPPSRVIFLSRSQEFGKKWITTVLVRISSVSAWIGAGGRRGELDVVLVLLAGVLRLARRASG